MGTSKPSLHGAKALLVWCREAPAGTRLDAREVARILEHERFVDVVEEPTAVPPSDPWTWRERLWACPAETRLGTDDLAEALGRPKSWIYSRTQKGAEDPIPHGKLAGSLSFTAEEVRHWIRENEVAEVYAPMESTPMERRLQVLEGEAA